MLRTPTQEGNYHSLRSGAPHPIYLLSCFLLLLLVGCRQRAGLPPIRVAMLPILDTLPLYVAAQEGLFVERGLEVELVPVASAAERDQLLQAGQVDAVITDLVALALYNRQGASERVTAVRYAMVPTAEFPQFRVLGAPGGAERVAEVRGVPIGVSQGTVIEYVTARLLQAQGVPDAEILFVAVPRIPERMALLNAGELAAATLPEPLGTLAQQQGASVIVDDSQLPEISGSLYAFRQRFMERPGADAAVRAFLDTIAEASSAINADKDAWDALLAGQALLPPSLQGSYILPDYPGDTLPTRAQYADVVAWLVETGRLQAGESAPYDDVVKTDF